MHVKGSQTKDQCLGVKYTAKEARILQELDGVWAAIASRATIASCVKGNQS